MIHRYAEWTRKRASTAQCSPALAILGCLVCFGIVVYIYRKVILTTLIDALMAAAAATVFVAVVAIVVSTLRWYRKSQKVAKATILSSTTEPMPALAADGDTWTKTTDNAAQAAITAEADWLAAEGVELAFSPDGKTLKVKKG